MKISPKGKTDNNVRMPTAKFVQVWKVSVSLLQCRLVSIRSSKPRARTEQMAEA